MTTHCGNLYQYVYANLSLFDGLPANSDSLTDLHDHDHYFSKDFWNATLPVGDANPYRCWNTLVIIVGNVAMIQPKHYFKYYITNVLNVLNESYSYTLAYNGVNTQTASGGYDMKRYIYDDLHTNIYNFYQSYANYIPPLTGYNRTTEVTLIQDTVPVLDDVVTVGHHYTVRFDNDVCNIHHKKLHVTHRTPVIVGGATTNVYGFVVVYDPGNTTGASYMPLRTEINNRILRPSLDGLDVVLKYMNAYRINNRKDPTVYPAIFPITSTISTRRGGGCKKNKPRRLTGGKYRDLEIQLNTFEKWLQSMLDAVKTIISRNKGVQQYVYGFKYDTYFSEDELSRSFDITNENKFIKSVQLLPIQNSFTFVLVNEELIRNFDDITDLTPSSGGAAVKKDYKLTATSRTTSVRPKCKQACPGKPPSTTTSIKSSRPSASCTAKKRSTS